MYKYKVSVIMAVYNVELFLREAIDSVIAQSIGFENIQLILVDDGSLDGSGAICDEYAAQYPDNIVVIHKENGGVSSARNAGLEVAEGEYLNLMDADDMISDNTCQCVLDFFETHADDVDVVSFPMVFFGDRTGQHILNNKYSKGTRVIDLRKEYHLIQLSTASSFIKRECIETLGLKYDKRLKFTEDAKLLVPILCRKMRLGVVSECCYHCRRRNVGEMSATQQSGSRKEWWLDTLRFFQMDTIEYCMKTMGYIPKYVQYLMAYDLQWRLQQKTLPQDLLDENEIQAFQDLMHDVLSYIDDDIIWMQKSIWREHKVYALRKKYGVDPDLDVTTENVQFYYKEKEIFSLDTQGINLAFLTIENGVCNIDGFLMMPNPELEGIEIEVRGDNGKCYACKLIDGPEPTTILGETAQNCIAFRAEIPLDDQWKTLGLTFVVKYAQACVTCTEFRTGRFFPIDSKTPASYYYKDHHRVVLMKNRLIILKSGWWDHVVCEAKFLKKLFKLNRVGSRKAIAARLASSVMRLFKRKPLLLLSDRITRGGDNGEAMYRYIQENHAKDVDAVFVVSKNSPDYAKLQKIGRVVDSQSYLHKLLLLICDYNLSSSAEIETANPFFGYDLGYRDLLNNVKYVFLQHGITKDDISGWINRYAKNMYGVVAAANAEYNAFVEGKYCYEPDRIWLTGFPRFDRLYRDERNCITIVPTWRKNLMGRLDARTGIWNVGPNFRDSEFRNFYHDLLNHPRLHEVLKKNGYKLQFFPHPNLQGVVSEFEISPEVEILGPETLYRDLYATSKLIVTDYSSAVFDFSYLRKPIVYCQFDVDSFFSGTHSYSKGYFDYERDGFGEVEYTLEGTVDRIIEYVENDCRLKDRYRQRIDDFFAFADTNNCQRVYERIMNMEHK